MLGTPVTIGQTLNELLNAGAHSALDVVQFVDNLIRLCADHRLCVRLEPSQCLLLAVGNTHSAQTIMNPLRTSQFRAVLARIAVRCNESSTNATKLYAGEWEISFSGEQDQRIKVSLYNTLDSQFVELEAISSADPIEPLNSLSGQQLFSCYESLSDIECDLFEAISREPAGPADGRTTFLTFVPRFKEVVKQILPDSNPLLLFFAADPESPNGSTLSLLQGFDELGGSSMIEDDIRTNASANGRTPYQLVITDLDACEWMATKEIMSVFSMPVRARVFGNVEIVGYMLLTLNKECKSLKSAAIRSLLRRFGLMYQQTINAVQLVEPIDGLDHNG